MAATYTNTPISINDIFTDLVAEVAVNLDIAIKFKFGTWTVVQNELISDSASTDNDVKNWSNCIALIHDTDEKPQGWTAEMVMPRIVIVTKSESTWKSQKRNDQSYIPTLYPMWLELGSVISNSGYFLGYNSSVLPKRDLFHIGTEGAQGKDGYLLPKVLDGLIIEGLSLQLNLQPPCGYEAPNLCLLTPCQYGLEVYFENIFKNVTFTGLGTNTITASVNDFTFTDASGGLPPPFAPEVSWQGGAYVAMNVPTPPAIVPYLLSYNVATGFGDGIYVGEIRFLTAHVQFYYEVSGGVVVKLTTEILQDVEFSIACADYPAYPATVNISMTLDSFTTKPPVLDRYTLDIFGVNKVDNSFALTDQYTLETVTTLAHMAVNQSIVNTLYAGSHVALEQKSIYKTQCKTEF